VLLVLFVGACSSKTIDAGPVSQASTATDCIEKYSTHDGYGFGGPSGSPLSPPPGTDAGPVVPPAAPDVAASLACANAGAHEAPDDPAACKADAFMSVDAALCIARASGLAEGQSGLVGSLLYNYKLRRVIYSVQNTLHEEPGRANGDVMAVDAITGAVLERGSWESVA
jgi:hypothetical protein